MKQHITEINLLQKTRSLEVCFEEGARFVLSCEYLRVFSPSAEVKQHGGAEVLVSGKKDVNIIAIEPVGQYAVRLVFSDGHRTGLYTFDYLYELGEQQEQNWQTYLNRLLAEGATRE